MSDEIEKVEAFCWLDSYHPTREAAEIYRARSHIIGTCRAKGNSGLIRANYNEVADFILENSAEIERILLRLEKSDGG